MGRLCYGIRLYLYYCIFGDVGIDPAYEWAYYPHHYDIRQANFRGEMPPKYISHQKKESSMKNRKRPKWLQWLKERAYEWSCHTDIQKALEKARFEGVQAGLKEVKPVIYGQYHEPCGFRLTEIMPNHFICELCEPRERNTGPMLLYRPGVLMMAERERIKQKKKAMIPDTHEMEAMRIQNYRFHQGPFTRDLSKLKGEQNDFDRS
jgi:hypothetical protein